MSDIEYGYCHCGCGEKTRIAKQTDTRAGNVKGEPVRFIYQHHSRRNPAARFFLKVNMPEDTSGCWEWMGYRDGDGYGAFPINRAPVRAYRFAYELLRGEIPAGLVIDHLCRNRGCVNPWHLEAVTVTENTRRGANTKLTMADAREIRRRYVPWSRDSSMSMLAAEYGVTSATISHIITGDTWREDVS